MPLTFRGAEHAVPPQQDVLPNSPRGGETNATFSNLFTTAYAKKKNHQKFSEIQTNCICPSCLW